MVRSKILVTGTSGQVGFELLRCLQGLGEVVGVDRSKLNLSDPDALDRVLREVAPDIIVNPAAYTAVDRAETEPVLAELVNATAPRVMAEHAARTGALLVHYSTDYVFDGAKSSPYLEDDPTSPLNVYGRTKRDGEQAIANSGCKHLIFRTSWVYGARGRNFMQTMLRLAQERQQLNVVADQFGAPTWSRTIATLTASILARNLAESSSALWLANSGIYNLTAGGRTSWAGFAEAIFERARLANVPIVTPIPSSAYPTPARRPANSVLSHEKLNRVFGLQPPLWQDALQLCFSD